ncbi:hypothetical protein EXIGLDRAFT_782313 [Exidia glandulosa HHB12029]|uniref:Clathrin/coatomer adaptor adaptin-like N-terminal domain-containing protein n=1 Tax=Exidia glandulosa HHB12029 TaxID=1314781 RepID=A0A165AW61_EXIGL|nr:hypothetical protein EXIGLDRAFT_782313 [Exidia glandulosa HHB12029]
MSGAVALGADAVRLSPPSSPLPKGPVAPQQAPSTREDGGHPTKVVVADSAPRPAQLTFIVPSHPHLLAEHQRTILASVDDADVSIRIRALDLVSEMVTEDNIQSIVQHLLWHLTPSSSTASAVQSLQCNLAQDGATPTTTPAAGLSRAYRLTLAQRILAILQ